MTDPRALPSAPPGEAVEGALRVLVDTVEVTAGLRNDIEVELRQALEDADRRCAAASAEAEREAAAQEAEAERRRDERSEATHNEAEARLRAAGNARESARRAEAERHAARLAAVERALKEALWLAETVAESDEAQSRRRYESELAALRDARLWLDGVPEFVRERLHERGVPARACATVDWDDRAHADDERHTEPDSPPAHDAVAERVERLGKSFGVRLARSGVFAGIATGLAVLAGAGAAATGAPSPVLWIAPLCVVAASVPVWFLLRRAAVRRVRQEAEDIAADLHRARREIERRAALAREERQREQATVAQKRAREAEEARAAALTRQTAEDEEHRQRADRIDSEHTPAIEHAQRELDDGRRQTESEFAERVEAARRALGEAVDAARRIKAEAERTARAHAAERIAALAARWAERTGEASAVIERVRALPECADDPWADPASAGAPRRGGSPAAIRVGGLVIDLGALGEGVGDVLGDERFETPALLRGTVVAPALLDLAAGASFAAEYSDADARERATAMVRAVLLRYLATMPPGKVKLTVVDPVGFGRSFAGFMHLADAERSPILDRIWSEPAHIERRLVELTEHIERVIQKYLRNDYPTIAAYNAAAGELAEPERLLVLADFPAGFEGGSAARLASILESGPRCGVRVLLTRDTERPPPEPLDDERLARGSVRIRVDADGARRVGGVGERFAFVPERSPAEEEQKRALRAIAEAAIEGGRVRVPFDAVTPAAESRWTLSTAERVRVPLGRSGATRLQYLTLGEGTAQHALIAGRTGSGKSTLLHAIITSASLWCSPDELELYLIDFKKGVEFRPYAGTGPERRGALPHARVVGIETDREFGVSALRRVDEELRRRGEQFREVGVQSLAAFRSRAGRPMPRTVVIIDEFQELFVEDDTLAQEAALLLDRLVRQGRAFGVHAVLGSQTLGGAYALNRTTMAQMNVRIALQCSEADSYLILSEDNAAARLLSRPGEAIYNDAGGQLAGNSPFQVVWLDEDEREEHLREVVDRAASEGLAKPAPVVFEGHAPARLAECRPLVEAVNAAPGPTVSAPSVWLGTPIAIKAPTAAALRRAGGANLSIVGGQEETALALIGAAAIGLSAQDRAAAVFVVDATAPDSARAGWLTRLGARLNGNVRVGGPADAPGFVEQAHAEMERRRASSLAGEPGVFVLVHGLHRCRSLRAPEDDFGFSSGDDDNAPSAGALFAELCREGPAVGVHAAVWCESVHGAERALGRSGLREFGWRVAMQMSANDSTAYVDGTAAARLGMHRALLQDVDSGVSERFRPFALPEPHELDAVLPGH